MNFKSMFIIILWQFNTWYYQGTICESLLYHLNCGVELFKSRVEAEMSQWYLVPNQSFCFDCCRELGLNEKDKYNFDTFNKAEIARLTVKSELRICLLGCSSSVISRISNYTSKQHVTPCSIGTCHRQGGCLRSICSISNNIRSCSHIWCVGAVIGQGHFSQFPHDGGHLCSQTTDITFYSERSGCAIFHFSTMRWHSYRCRTWNNGNLR